MPRKAVITEAPETIAATTAEPIDEELTSLETLGPTFVAGCDKVRSQRAAVALAKEGVKACRKAERETMKKLRKAARAVMEGF
jgi:capsular polysaccharide biosynthesis protein